MLTHAGQAYVVLDTLGEGGSGKVMYAKSQTGYSVAIKVVHKAKAYRDPYGRENLVNEKCNWERVTHERRSFLVSLLLSWDDPENVYFVMVSMSPLSVGSAVTDFRGIASLQRKLVAKDPGPREDLATRPEAIHGRACRRGKQPARIRSRASRH